MPSVHRNALKKLMETIKRRIHDDEARLLNAADDAERTKLVAELAELHIRYKETRDALLGEDDAR
jgi:hypothetical protein